jgi:rod shape-determining protein MreD
MYKMNKYVIAAIILTAALLQITVINSIRIWKVRPDILLIMVVFFAFNGGTRLGVRTGAFAGFLKDIFTDGPFACWTITFALAGFLVGFYRNRFYRENLYTQISMTLLSFLFSSVFYYLLADLFTEMPSFYQSLLLLIIPAAIYTAIFSPVIFLALDRIWLRKKIL